MASRYLDVQRTLEQKQKKLMLTLKAAKTALKLKSQAPPTPAKKLASAPSLPKIGRAGPATAPVIKDLRKEIDKVEQDIILGQDLSPINVQSKNRKLSENIADQSNLIETEALLKALDKAADEALRASKSGYSNILNTIQSPDKPFAVPAPSKAGDLSIDSL